MFYTRRKFLQQTSAASVLAGVSSACPSLSHASARPSSFGPGVRVFFIGTWLFCKDPESDQPGTERLLAITMDAGMGHHFPWGPWKDITFDKGPSLEDNQQTGKRAHKVAVNGFQTAFHTAQELFSHANSDCEFVYATIKRADLEPTLKGDMRVISLPVPTKLYTGIFETQHTISTSDSVNYSISGNKAATGHVFEYLGGTLSKKDCSADISSPLSADFQGDYHFRTVPPDCSCHGAKMFDGMLQTVFNVPSGTVSLSAPCDDHTKPSAGNYLPASVTDEELDIIDVSCPSLRSDSKSGARQSIGKNIENEHGFFRTTAACAGASIGVLGTN